MIRSSEGIRMLMKIISMILMIISLIVLPGVESFESLLDNDYYSINWKGPMQLSGDDEPLKEASVIVTTTNKEKYKCVLPTVDSNTRSQFRESFSSAKLELDYLRPLLDSSTCVYRLEVFWTYEFCHGKHIRQYHEENVIGKLPIIQEYYLGRYSFEKFKEDLKRAETSRKIGNEQPKPQSKNVQGMDMPYYEVIYEEGTICDLNGVPRRSRVQFVCSPGSRGEIYELKETSTCEYEIVVLTSALCQHPSYGPRKDPVHTIDCHSLQNSPKRPLNLEIFELQNTLGGYGKMEEGISDAIWNVVKQQAYADEMGNAGIDDGEKVEKKKENIAEGTVESGRKLDGASFKAPPSSKQILVDFFNGDYCISGGSGWWKHEFCYRKYIRQYHESSTGRDIITLGVWNEEKHLDWLSKNPLKQPRSPDKRKFLYNFYGEGAYCQESRKNRSVEVRFNCAKTSESTNAISLFLVENVVCEYVLVVEGSLFCNVIQNADQNGFMHFQP